MNTTSLNKLKTAHPDLVKLAMAVDEIYPIQVICGHRTNEDQQKALDAGNSKLPPGKSKHNRLPSLAIDCVPDPDRDPKTISWVDLNAFEIMCHVFEQKADEMDIKIRLGRDFSFRDLPHVELVT